MRTFSDLTIQGGKSKRGRKVSLDTEALKALYRVLIATHRKRFKKWLSNPKLRPILTCHSALAFVFLVEGRRGQITILVATAHIFKRAWIQYASSVSDEPLTEAQRTDAECTEDYRTQIPRGQWSLATPSSEWQTSVLMSLSYHLINTVYIIFMCIHPKRRALTFIFPLYLGSESVSKAASLLFCTKSGNLENTWAHILLISVSLRRRGRRKELSI